MRARDLLRRIIPTWLNARQALALSNLCMSASEAIWDVHEEKMYLYITRCSLDKLAPVGLLNPLPDKSEDLPF